MSSSIPELFYDTNGNLEHQEITLDENFFNKLLGQDLAFNEEYYHGDCKDEIIQLDEADRNELLKDTQTLLLNYMSEEDKKTITNAINDSSNFNDLESRISYLSNATTKTYSEQTFDEFSHDKSHTQKDDNSTVPSKKKNYVCEGVNSLADPKAINSVLTVASNKKSWFMQTPKLISCNHRRQPNEKISEEERRKLHRRSTNCRAEARRRAKIQIYMYLIARITPMPQNACDIRRLGTVEGLLRVVYMYIREIQITLQHQKEFEIFQPNNHCMSDVLGKTVYNLPKKRKLNTVDEDPYFPEFVYNELPANMTPYIEPLFEKENM